MILIRISTILFLVLPVSLAYQCVWYGNCYQSPKGQLPCAYNGPPKMLNDTDALSFLRSTCPLIFKPAPNGEPMPTCCSADQAKLLRTSLQPLQNFFSRCPICYSNLVHLFCSFTCGPDQTRFMTDIGTAIADGKKYVNNVGVLNVSESTGNGMWDSCVNVQYPSANKPVVNVLLNDDPTLKGLLHYIGDPTSPYVPFGMNFTLVDESNAGINYPTFKCNESNPQACSCSDCPSACKEPWCPPSDVETPCLIAGVLDCSLFYAIIAAGSVCLIILIASIALKLVQTQRSRGSGNYRVEDITDPRVSTDSTTPEAIPTDMSKLGFREKYEVKLATAFHYWGLICCAHPVKVIVIGFLFAGGLSCGLLMPNLKPITNPVDLWSAPGSLERQHKDYFDQHFGPFYRTEQIIIKPKDNETFEWDDCLTFDPFKFSPVFKYDFLKKISNLTLEINNLVAEYNNKPVTLNDICLQPLSPDNTNCSFMHPMQYFQNNIMNIDMDSECYERHFLTCLDTPASVCLRIFLLGNVFNDCFLSAC